MTRSIDSFKRTTISLRLDEYETLRYLAFKGKTSIAGVVRELIRERLEDEEDIRDGLTALEEINSYKKNPGKGRKDSSAEPPTMDWETFKKDVLGL